MSLDDFPRYPLTFGPSPVHPLERLSAHLGGPTIWAKREDCNSGLAFGGNKTRKLEYLVPDALAQGADTLVSIGGVQSNHTRQVAPYAIPAGASDHRLGGLGFARWAQEVKQQEQQLGLYFDTIIVCSVTGSTQAGMIAGFAGQERPRRVLGIDASAKLDETRAQVAKIARNTAELIGLGRELRDDEEHRAARLGRRLLRHPGAIHAGRDPAHRAAGRRDHRSGVRGQIDGGAHRPYPYRPDRPDARPRAVNGVEILWPGRTGEVTACG